MLKSTRFSQSLLSLRLSKCMKYASSFFNYLYLRNCKKANIFQCQYLSNGFSSIQKDNNSQIKKGTGQIFQRQVNRTQINLGLLFQKSEKKSFNTLLILNNRFRMEMLNYLIPQCQQIVIADGGANLIFNSKWKQSQKIKKIIGDLDSIKPEVLSFYKDANAQIKLVADQNSTDYQKCMKEICSQNKNGSILVFGCLGGRLDHFFSILSSTERFIKQFPQIKLILVGEQSLICSLPKGRSLITIPPNLNKGQATLVTFGKSEGISSKGFKWEYGEDLSTLQWGKNIYTSNEITGNELEVISNGNVSLTLEFKK